MNLVERYRSVLKEPPKTKLMAKAVVLRERIGMVFPSREYCSFLNWTTKIRSLKVDGGSSKIEVNDEESEIHLKPGQNIAEMHLIPSSKNTLVGISLTMKELAKHIQDNKLPVEYVLGITYDRLANASKRFGFKVLDCPLTQDEKELFKKSLIAYQKAGLIDGELGDLKLIIQRRSDFLARFGVKV